MSGEAFVINDPPGSFVVKSLDGGNAFDSRLPTQRIYMTGTTDLLGPSDVNGINNTAKFVDYGRTFGKIPYVRSAARQVSPSPPTGGLVGYYSPLVSWTINALNTQFANGHFTHATTTGLYLGNIYRGSATLRYVYAIFENPVEF